MPKVNPQILTWARGRAGLSLEDAARAIGLSGANAAVRLEEIEAGEREPSRRQLVEMAKKYRRPLLTFYLSAPPESSRRTHDFRTLPQRDTTSEAMLDALVRDVQARQALVRNALEDAEEGEVLPFVGSIQAQQGADALVAAMQETLSFDLSAYRQARSYDRAFAVLRDSIEAAGVFVLLMGNLGSHHSSIGAETFRGLAIADSIAPFIVINENDSRSAWPFTLLHELAHIFLGESGISGYDSDQAIERVCDEAAARFLLKPVELDNLATQQDANLDDLIQSIGAFASDRYVSRKMVAYNLLRLRRISYSTYNRLVERFDADRRRGTVREGAPDFYVVRRHRMGRGLVRFVNRMVAGGILSTTKAGKVLGIKPTAVDRMTKDARAA